MLLRDQVKSKSCFRVFELFKTSVEGGGGRGQPACIASKKIMGGEETTINTIEISEVFR